jgi:predicted nucleotidyltransferase
VKAETDSSPIEAIRSVAARQPGLTLLVLFGSRARGDESARSDWDFGYLADRSADPLMIMAALAEAVGSDRLDVVDLARASGLLRYRAARDGVLVYEATPGCFDRFRFEAARFWFDAEPVLRPGYDAILDRLGR